MCVDFSIVFPAEHPELVHLSLPQHVHHHYTHIYFPTPHLVLHPISDALYVPFVRCLSYIYLCYLAFDNIPSSTYLFVKRHGNNR